MPRRRKSGIDYWLENCFRCKEMIRSHYLHNGVDNGSVSYTCTLTGEYVTPWDVDGCKQFNVGDPQEVIIETEKSETNEKSKDT